MSLLPENYGNEFFPECRKKNAENGCSWRSKGFRSGAAPLHYACLGVLKMSQQQIFLI